MTLPRVVSLIASATETVAALGGETQLVGRSHECDYPFGVTRLPMCSQPRIDIEGTSLQIDERVRSALREALSIYRVLPERLQELRPDVIITQTQCEVCAVSLADVEEAVCNLIDSRPQIVALEPNCLADIWRDILRVAEAIGRRDPGEALVSSLQERLEAIGDKARQLPQPTVAGIEWIEPVMTGGNWMPEIIEIAGGQNLFGEAGK
ncbi:MAG TPA: ABC transporter substrate-binding protein, partial [Planctomycetaceae bacterium]|nr:ABC transporter substrate-binding protein [Planctomycetaceae bacterium]